MFENVKAQRRTVVFFAFVYLVFGAAFFFLLFMTPGLEFSQEKTNNTIEVYLVNNSIHLIHSIEVKSDGEPLLSVERLMPQERVVVPIEQKKETISLSASAPYHAKVTRTFSIVESDPDENGAVELNFGVTVPTLGFVDFGFDASIEVCNQGKSLDNVLVEESHGAEFFKESNKSEGFSLNEGECRTASFPLTPAKTGTTKIYFKVKALSYNREIEREIRIEE